MNKPVLVVMAAGMGSRYGGMKQIDPVGPNGQVIMDYSLYDARRAGFETVIFVIKHEIEDAFKAAIGDRVAKAMKVKYAFQQLEELPAGFAVPEGRVKPWGTCHAVLAAKPLIDGPFAVINADDYYGPEAFQVMYDYLSTHADDDFYRYCMVSYLLKNTLSENGSVARGVCIKNEDGTLQSVTERTRIEPCDGGAHYTEDGGESWVDLPGDTPVSMNLWGFGKSFLDEAEQRFAGWLTENLPVNPLKCEYFLPLVVTELIEENKAKFRCCAARISGSASPTGRISLWWWRPLPARPPRASTPKNCGSKCFAIAEKYLDHSKVGQPAGCPTLCFYGVERIHKNRSSWMRLSSSKSCSRWARRFAPGAALG